MQATGYIRNHPLIRITFIYIIGIGIAELCQKLDFNLFYLLAIIAISVFLIILLTLKNRALNFIYRGIVLYFLFLLAAIINYQLSSQYNRLPPNKMHYSGIVVNSPLSKDKSTQIDCMIKSIKTTEGTIRLNEKVRLYLEPDTNRTLPAIGDSLTFYGQLSKIRNPGNPGEFNYSGYMKHLGIHYSGYIKKADYSFGGNSGLFKIRRFSSFLQKQLIAYFKHYKIQGDELAVLSALTAGNRTFLDQDLKESYAAVGAMHILAVSGLHVGILYLLLTLIFGNRNQKNYYRLIRTLLILAVIWMYAFMTGLSSSVLRASIMFSLFLIGKNLRQQVDSYNILAASALLILIINPLELFKVGFQFSYLAVAGIIFFQPRLEKLIIIRNGILDRIWQLFTVSIAAQLITFPLSLYYFHQFPVYFWLTNLAVIPLVWLIMASAVVFSLFIPLSFLLPFIAGILNLLLKILNQVITAIGELPYSTIIGIRFDTIQLITFYAFLLIVIVLILQKQYRQLIYPILSLLIILLIDNIVTQKNSEEKKEFIAYNIRGNDLVISLIDGTNHTVITKGVDSFEDDNIQYLRNFWISRKINRDINWIPFEKETPGKILTGPDLEIQFIPKGFLIDFYDNKCFCVMNVNTLNYKNSKAQKEKILIIDRDSGFPDESIIRHIAPDIILEYGSMTKYIRNAWQEFAKNYEIDYYSISDRGAYWKVEPKILKW